MLVWTQQSASKVIFLPEVSLCFQQATSSKPPAPVASVIKRASSQVCALKTVGRNLRWRAFFYSCWPWVAKVSSTLSCVNSCEARDCLWWKPASDAALCVVIAVNCAGLKGSSSKRVERIIRRCSSRQTLTFSLMSPLLYDESHWSDETFSFSYWSI